MVSEDAAAVALIRSAEPYVNELGINYDDMWAELRGGEGTCSLFMSYHEEDQVGFQIGQYLWHDAYFGSYDQDARAREVAHVTKAVLEGAIVESLWRRAGRVVKAKVVLRDEQEIWWQHGLIPIFGNPIEVNRYSSYAIK